MIKKLLFIVLWLSSAVFTTEAAMPNNDAFNKCMEDCVAHIRNDKNSRPIGARELFCMSWCRT